MKLLLSVLLLFPFCGSSQITLNTSDFADGGDTVRISITTDAFIDFTSTGPNYTWDFSTLVPTSQILGNYTGTSDFPFLVNFIFGGSAAVDYQATNFKASNDIPVDLISSVLPVTISDVNQFSKNSADSITSVGFSIVLDGNSIPFKSDTIETRYKFPLNYTDTYSSKGYTNLDMNPFYNAIWRQYRERNSTVDGWGNITTPYGSFNALRIDHLITETDSIYMEVFGTPTWIELPIPDSHIYEWWTNGELEPILRITTSDILGAETVTNIEYKDIYRGLDASLLDQTLNYALYPNPAIDELRIDDLQSDANYSIVSLEGAIVSEGNLTVQKNSIDISMLNQGAYQFMINQNGAFQSIMFIKK